MEDEVKNVSILSFFFFFFLSKFVFSSLSLSFSLHLISRVRELISRYQVSNNSFAGNNSHEILRNTAIRRTGIVALSLRECDTRFDYALCPHARVCVSRLEICIAGISRRCVRAAVVIRFARHAGS